MSTKVISIPSRHSMPALAMNEEELMQVLENSLYPGASRESIKLVIGYCRASGLDPMQKPCHIVPMWDGKAQGMRDVVMPGIGLYRTQAARSEQLAGISEPEFGPDVAGKVGGADITYPQWCRVVVKRRLPTGEIAEFSAIERWIENYAVKGGKEKSIAPNTMWMRRPYAQLAKCAQAQALRMAFPEMTGAQPTADEMEGKEIDMGTTVREDAALQQPKELLPYTDADMQVNLPKWHAVILAGKKTAAQIIATISSKYTLSAAQMAAITPPLTVADVDEAALLADLQRGGGA